MTSLIRRRLSQPITLLTYTPEHIVGENRDEPAWVQGATVSAVVSAVSSTELSDVGQDIMNRRKIVRLFGAYSINGFDRIIIAGETFEIDGIPNIARGVSGQTITTVYAVKVGENS